MDKKTIEKQLTVVRDEESNLIKTIIINASNKELEMQKIYGWDEPQLPYLFSIYYAASDYLRHKRYEHPLTQHGLHFYKDRGIKASNSFLQLGIAAICVDFEDTREMFPTLPSVKRFPLGWATVNKEDRIYTFSDFEDPADAARKHRAVDWLMDGFGFELHVPRFLAVPKNKGVNGEVAWAETVVANWQNTNDAEALADRNNRIGASIDNQKLYEGAQVMKKSFGNGASDMASIVGTAEVTMFDNTVLSLDKLELRRYKLFNGSRPLRTVYWDPNNQDAVALIAQAVRRKWKLQAL